MDARNRFSPGEVARLLACALVSGHFAHAALAAPTDIADVPMAVKNTVAPNIMFTLDNSGSMSWTYMPDSVGLGSTKNYAMDFSRNCTRNAYYNQVYFNPALEYTPPVKSDGNSYGDVSFIKAPFDGFDTSKGTINLSSKFQADMYVPSAFSDKNDTVQAAYYYKYTGTNPATPVVGVCYPNGSYEKVVVGAAEQQKFANWFSYYRTRMLMMKTALGRTFSKLDSGYRVGFSTINDDSGDENNNGDNFLNIKNFDATQKASWYAQLYAVKPGGGTPLQEALRKDGEYYSTGKMPGASGSIDPIQKDCQQNYTILSTDGFWNGTEPNIGNWDATIPNLPEPVTGLTKGNQWPTPIWEGDATVSRSNTLADMAMKYWVTDLRSTMDNKVPANPADPATWQHMTTFTIGLADGTLANPDGLPTTAAPNWPKPNDNLPTTIDDLWHAAINGHGAYLKAKDPDSLTASLTSILDNIASRTGAAASVAVSNPNFTDNDNFAYASSYSYNSGNWWGDLQAYSISKGTDPNTKQPIIVISDPLWSAATLLDAVAAKNSNNASASRYIATYTGAAGIPFLWANLTTTQQSSLHTPVNPPGTSDGATVLNYLRGDRTKEGSDYRARTHLLGDIINSDPVVVREPMNNFADTGYSDYKNQTGIKDRAKTLYQGANDGMLHAFDAATGGELWAYVPSFVIPNLNNLSRKTGFTHKYYIGATPVAADVDFSYPAGTKWRTILVGGLGKGGRGYYALDVTAPTAGSDTAAAGKVLWEFPNNNTVFPAKDSKNNVGYSYGKPIIVKTEAAGWVVLVTSGYNNGNDTSGDGAGRLWVLNAQTGQIIASISTDAGSKDSPSGLAQISAFVQNADIDNTVDYVYGGDLLGNVWRFDLTGKNTNQWNVKKLATLVDADGKDGKAQPITTAPELGQIIINNAAKRFVYVGTGLYLGDTDIPGATGANYFATQTQTMYGLIDDLSNNPTLTSLRGGTLQQQTLSSAAGDTRTIKTNPVDYASKKGWYLDFSLTQGERVVSDPVLALGMLAFTTIIPSSDPCKPGGSSWLYLLDYQTGGKLTTSTLSWSGKSLGNSLVTSPTIFKLPDGSVQVTTNNSGKPGAPTDAGILSTSGTVKRISWRELTD